MEVNGMRNREMANIVIGSETEVEGSSIPFNEDAPSLDAFTVT